MNCRILIHPNKTPKCSYSLCRLNPALKGGRKWQPVFFVEVCEEMDEATVRQTLISQGRATIREFNRNQVLLRPA